MSFQVLLVVLIITYVSSLSYPTRIKDVVSKMTQATQAALQQRNSRMEIELPPTADFGVESAKKAAGLSTADQIKKSNREAARLFTEMFSSISSTCAVLFPTETEAAFARNLWGATFRGKVLSIDTPDAKGYGKLRSRKFSAIEQEQALLGSDGIYIPDGTEVLIISGPRSKDTNKIIKITEKLTDATLIILLNSRSSAMTTITSNRKSSSNSDSTTTTTTTASSESTNNESDLSYAQWVQQIYKPVFHYAPPILPQDIEKKNEYLLYYEYNKNWSLGSKESNTNNSGNKNILNTIGNLASGNSGFKTIWEGPDRPSNDDIITYIKNSNNS